MELIFVALFLLTFTPVKGGLAAATAAAVSCCSLTFLWCPFYIPVCITECLSPIPTPDPSTLHCQALAMAAMVSNPF